jgi:hypothetical protein
MKPQLLIALSICTVFSCATSPAETVKPESGTKTETTKTVAIVGGRVLTITHGTIENGTVIMSAGKIAAVGPTKTTKVPRAQRSSMLRE